MKTIQLLGYHFRKPPYILVHFEIKWKLIRSMAPLVASFSPKKKTKIRRSLGIFHRKQSETTNQKSILWLFDVVMEYHLYIIGRSW